MRIPPNSRVCKHTRRQPLRTFGQIWKVTYDFRSHTRILPSTFNTHPARCKYMASFTGFQDFRNRFGGLRLMQDVVKHRAIKKNVSRIKRFGMMYVRW